MERRVKVIYGEEGPDLSKLMRLLCEAVHSCYEMEEAAETEKAA